MFLLKFSTFALLFYLNSNYYPGVHGQVQVPIITGDEDPSVQYGPPGFTPGEPLGLGYYTDYPTGPTERQMTTITTLRPTTGSPGGYGYGLGRSSALEQTDCNNTDLERNKRLIMDFYQTALRDKRADLMDQFLAEDYLNHSPYSNERGRADFQRIMTQGGLAPEPSQVVDFKRVDAIEDRVWVHSTWLLNGTRFSVMDLWTVNCDGLMQEHWDVLQATNIPTRNPVPFFS